MASESLSAPVLDNGATNTVAGKISYNCHRSSLIFHGKTKLKRHKGINIYRFGDGNIFTVIENVDIPIVLGKQHVMPNRDIVVSAISLLLSRKYMRKTDMTIDFRNYNAIVFGESVKLTTTKSGHYTIPISPYKLSLIILQQE